MAIIDTHIHLWDLDRFSVDWIGGIPALNRSFLFEEWRTLASDGGVDGAVFVQAEVAPDQALAEALWVDGLARDNGRIVGIVAQAPLEDRAMARERLDALSDCKHLVGIRRLIQSEPDPEFCLQPSFVDGVKALGERGLAFDICVSHDQLGSVLALARQCPQTRLVLDHMGKPDIKNGLYDAWALQFRQLAGLDHVVCKLSGLPTEADPEAWSVDQLRPYVDLALEAFGPDRLMFGSDWPVCTLATSYGRWIETVETLVSDLSPDEREAIMSGTARSAYGL